jgi:hypothetical protein
MPAIEDAAPRQIEEIIRAFVKLFTSVGSLVLEWAWCEMIIQAGWLPYASIPPELIADAKDVEDAGLRLENFFRENWPQISESLRRSVHAGDADADAKEAFDECLRAHALGLYRVAPALLFPHIERVARDALLPNAMGASAASLLFDAVGELGPSEFTMPGVSGVQLYSKLAEHLYKQVRTPDEVQSARLDPVPNRHAVLHGRVTYTSEKSSLNMLIMTNFIFDAVSKVARERSNKNVC